MSDHTLYVSSLYGYRTQQPRVQLTCPEADFTIQLSVPEARDVAVHLLEACAHAQSDAAMVAFLREDVGLGDGRSELETDEAVGQALNSFRQRLEKVQAQYGWQP